MATAEVDRLVVRLLGDISQYEKEMGEAKRVTTKTARAIENSTKMMEKSFHKVGRSIQAVGSTAQRVGRTMSFAFTLPLVGIGALATREFASFNQAMTESTSIMEVTDAQVKAMTDTAINLSSGGRAIQGANELAESYFFLASAGKNAEQSMALLPKVADFATAGAFDMALATDLLTDAQSALGLSSKDATKDVQGLTRVADTLVKANTLANSSVQQFSEALTNTAGASLRTFNKSVEEGVAVLAAYADQGIKGNVAGTSLSRVMLLLSKSSRDSADEHKRLGFEVFNAEGKMRNFADLIQNLEQITGGMSDEVKSATLEMLGFEARVQQAILPLLGTSQAVREYEKELNKAKGVTREIAEKQMKSFSNQLKIVKNQISGVGIEIGQVLAPFVLKLAERISNATKWFRELSPEMKRVAVTTGLVVAAIGPLLVSMGLLLVLTGAIVSAVGTMIGVVGTLVSALLSPITLLAVAIAGIGIAVIDFSGLWESAKKAVSSFVTFAKGFINNFQQNMGILFRWLEAQWKRTSRIVSGVWRTITSIVSKAIDSIISIVSSIFPSLEGMWDGVVEDSKSTFNSVLRLTSSFFSGMLGFFSNFNENVNTIWSFIERNWNAILKDMGNLFLAFTRNFIVNSQVMTKTGVRLFIAFQGFVSKIFEQLFTIDMLNSAIKGLVAVNNVFNDWAISAWETFRDVFTGKAEPGAAKDFIDQLKDDIVKGAEDINFVDTAARIIKEESKNLVSPLDGFESTIEETLKLNTEIEEIDLPEFNLEPQTQKVVNEAEDITKKSQDVVTNEIVNKQIESPDNTRLREDGRKLMEKFIDPQKIFDKTVLDLNRMKVVGAIDQRTFDMALAEAQKVLDDSQLEGTVQFKAEGIDAVDAASKDAIIAVRDYMRLRPDVDLNKIGTDGSSLQKTFGRREALFAQRESKELQSDQFMNVPQFAGVMPDLPQIPTSDIPTPRIPEIGFNTPRIPTPDIPEIGVESLQVNRIISDVMQPHENDIGLDRIISDVQSPIDSSFEATRSVSDLIDPIPEVPDVERFFGMDFSNVTPESSVFDLVTQQTQNMEFSDAPTVEFDRVPEVREPELRVPGVDEKFESAEAVLIEIRDILSQEDTVQISESGLRG